MMPEDVIVGNSIEKLDLSMDNTLFVLLAGTTEVSLRPGITAAGASPEATRLTPTVDSEIVGEGRCLSMSEPPMTPEGIPTPAIVSKAILTLTGLKYIIVNGGFSFRPKTDYLETNIVPSKDPSRERAIVDAEKVMESGYRLGKILDGRYRNIMVGESFPGGTTTAYIVLRAMGIKTDTSSSMPVDPDLLKKELAEESFRRKAVYSPLDAAIEYGDNLMIFMIGMSRAVRSSNLILAGGTQMANVAELIERINGRSEPIVATTSWVYSHRSKLFRDLGLERRTIVSVMNFGGMRNIGLRYYDQGHVREGVGMGGLYAVARLAGFTKEAINSSIDSFYSSFLQI
ncbi:TIGR00303 family protein [Thermoplasma sp. Kam2015]|nr:TIGR00303 family protein [Thermoplasma sp. Kam2015]